MSQAVTMNGTQRSRSTTRAATNRVWMIDYVLLLAVTLLIVIGLVMVASSSISIADNNFSSPFHYLLRQLVFLAIGLTLATGVFFVPLAVWQRIGPMVIIASIVMLVAVFIPGLGKHVNGSTRWINFGVFNLQVAEFVKLFVIIYLSSYLVRHTQALRTTVSGFYRPLVLMFIIVFLLLMQPDFGSSVVILVTALGMFWLGGAKFSQFMLIGFATTGAMALVAVASPTRMARLTTFINPWAEQYKGGFQLTQALIAFGRGDWVGVGLGNSIQKMFYLPEAHTDFIFAVVAEEFGMFGGFVVLALFVVLISRAILIGYQAEQREFPFGGYVAYGIGIWFGFQALVNIGVNMGVLPTKGLTLPFISYGGSSLVISCIAIALLLRIKHELHKYDRHVFNRDAR